MLRINFYSTYVQFRSLILYWKIWKILYEKNNQLVQLDNFCRICLWVGQEVLYYTISLIDFHFPSTYKFPYFIIFYSLSRQLSPSACFPPPVVHKYVRTFNPHIPSVHSIRTSNQYIQSVHSISIFHPYASSIKDGYNITKFLYSLINICTFDSFQSSSILFILCFPTLLYTVEILNL